MGGAGVEREGVRAGAGAVVTRVRVQVLAAITVVGITATLGVTTGVAGAQQSPTITVDAEVVEPGESLWVSGEGWLPASNVVVELCGTAEPDSTTACAVEGSRITSVEPEGRFSATMTAAEPPAPCPCEVRARPVSGVGATAAETVELQGVDTLRDDEATTATTADDASPRGVRIVEARVEGGGSWTEWFAGPTSRTVVVTVENVGTTRATFDLDVRVGTDVDATETVEVDPIQRLEPGSQAVVDVHVPFDALTVGSRTVVVDVPGQPVATEVWVRTTIVPWGLLALAVLVVAGAVVAVWLLVRRRRRARAAAPVPVPTPEAERDPASAPAQGAPALKDLTGFLPPVRSAPPEPVPTAPSEPEPTAPSEPEPSAPVNLEPEPTELVDEEPEPAEPVNFEPEPTAPARSDAGPGADEHAEAAATTGPDSDPSEPQRRPARPRWHAVPSRRVRPPVGPVGPPAPADATAEPVEPTTPPEEPATPSAPGTTVEPVGPSAETAEGPPTPAAPATPPPPLVRPDRRVAQRFPEPPASPPPRRALPAGPLAQESHTEPSTESPAESRAAYDRPPGPPIPMGPPVPVAAAVPPPLPRRVPPPMGPPSSPPPVVSPGEEPDLAPAAVGGPERASTPDPPTADEVAVPAPTRADDETTELDDEVMVALARWLESLTGDQDRFVFGEVPEHSPTTRVRACAFARDVVTFPWRVAEGGARRGGSGLRGLAGTLWTTGEGIPGLVVETADRLRHQVCVPATRVTHDLVEMEVADAVLRSVQRRVDELSAPARAVLSSAVTLGQEFTATQLADRVEASRTVIAAVLREASELDLVREIRSGRFRFAHHLIRAVLRRDAPDERSPYQVSSTPGDRPQGDRPPHHHRRPRNPSH